MRFLTIVLFCCLFFVACSQSPKSSLKTDKEKVSYAIGRQLGQNFKNQNLEIDAAALGMAVNDILQGKASPLTDQQMQEAMIKTQQAQMEKRRTDGDKFKKQSQEFLEKNKTAEGVKTTKSGLQYKVITASSGASPKDSDTVVVHYTGKLIDGTEFDSSQKRGQPAEFPVNAVIPGWTEALKLMHKGDKWMLYIPSELAYGEQGRPSIPPNSALIFEVELLEIKKKK